MDLGRPGLYFLRGHTRRLRVEPNGWWSRVLAALQAARFVLTTDPLTREEVLDGVRGRRGLARARIKEDGQKWGQGRRTAGLRAAVLGDLAQSACRAIEES